MSPYVKTNWQDEPSTATPISASALQNIENQLEANDLSNPGSAANASQSAAISAGITSASVTPRRSPEIGLAVRVLSSRFPKWTAAVSGIYAGTRDARILCVGDSTTAGVGVDSNGTEALDGCYPWQLADALDSLGLTAARGLSVPGPNASDPNAMYVLGSAWDYGSTDGTNLAWGRNSAYRTLSATPGSLVFTTGGAKLYDRFDIYYVTSSSNGVMVVSVDGGTGVSVDTAGTSGIGKSTVNAASPSGTHNVSITRTSGLTAPLIVIGVEPWLSTEQRIRVGNAGVGSSNAYDWARPAVGSGATVWDGLSSIRAYTPDLTIFSLGLNDARDSRTIPDWLTDMTALIGAAQASGDVLILPPFPVGPGASTLRKQLIPTYIDAIRRLNLPLLNISSRWGDSGTDVLESLGMRNADGVHPTASGYGDLSSVLASTIALVS